MDARHGVIRIRAGMYALVITSFIWALSFGLLGNCLNGVPADLVTVIRMAGALLVFLPFIRRMPIGLAGGMAGIGALQFGVMYLCYIASFQYLPSYQIAILTATTPVYIVLLIALRHRQLPLRHLVAALLAMVGGAGILWKGWASSDGQLMGILLVQLSNLCFAVGQLAYVGLKKKYPSVNNTACFAWVYVGALLITLPTGIPSVIESWRQVSAAQWWVLAYLGPVASGLCFFMWNYGACRVTPVKLALMNNLKIPLAALCSVLLFREYAQTYMLWLGCLLILAAFLVGLPGDKRE